MAGLGACCRARSVGALVVAVLCALASPAAHARQLTRGFADDVWFTGGQTWVQKTVVTGAKVAMVEVDWSAVEPSAPRDAADAANPNGPQYHFGYLDPVVREFAGTGISLAFQVTHAPRWAEAGGGPADLESLGAWRPEASAFGDLGRALAARYSGSYSDPATPGQPLPRVRYFEAWVEPNLAVHLAPQWVRSGHRWTYAAPSIYRGLLNAFYAGVKRAQPGAFVLSGGLAPFGDRIGTDRTARARTPPAQFVRSLLCLSGRRSLARQPCQNPAHFDVLAMDPYETSSPTTHAVNADDVSAPDLGKLTRIVKRAVKVGTALPRAHKPLWVTEFSYDSNPPNPTAVSTATQARWLEQALYVFWREGVSTVIWYLVRDQGGTAWATSYFSGVYFRDGRPKPSLTAYRFPFVVMGSTAWGIAPASGTVTVQRKSGHSWHTLFRLHASARGTFTHRVPSGLRGSFRALVNGQSSLAWKR